MEHLKEKSWKDEAVTNRKKFLARHYTHALSRTIPGARFEVVFESDLDPFHADSPQADVVVYDHVLNLHVAIEFSRHEDLLEMMLAACAALERYALDEFFICDYEHNTWYRLMKNESTFQENSRSELFSLNLQELSPHHG